MPSENYLDLTPFRSPAFNVNSYANAILAGETYNPQTAQNASASSTEASASGTGKGKGKAMLEETKMVGGGNARSGMGLTVKGDVGVALAKLNYGIEDVTKQLRLSISTHHPLLLSHLSSTTHLSTNLLTIQSSLSSLTSSLNRLQNKIHDPYIEIKERVERLEKIRGAMEVLRRLARVLVLIRRLDGQMRLINLAIRNGDKKDTASNSSNTKTSSGKGHELNGSSSEGGTQNMLNGRMIGGERESGVGGGEGRESAGSEKEREMIKAALTLAELESLLDPSSVPPSPADDGNTVSSSHPQSPAPTPLTSLDLISLYTPLINSSRETVIIEMENMIVSGLSDLNQPLLSTSLQTAYNLRLLNQLVGNLLADLNDAVEGRIGKVFDLASVGKEVASKETTSTQSAASAASSLIYRATRTQPSTTPTSSNSHLYTQIIWQRFELLIEDVANCCIKVYTLEKVLRNKKDPATGQVFLDEVMKSSEEKPSFLFWTTLATALDTKSRETMNANNFLAQTLSNSYPRLLRLLHEFFAKIAVHTDTVYTQAHQSPETVLILRSVSKFEQAYLARSTGRMTEAINASFAGGVKSPPTASDGIAIFRVMLNELDSARFDPLIGRSVARGVAKSLEGLAGRVDSMLVKDFSANALIGPSASSAQALNGSLISCLYHLTANLQSSISDLPVKVQEILIPAFTIANSTIDRPLDTLNTAIKREISNIILRIHKVDFSKPVDPMSMGGNGSPYMVDLADKLTFLRTEILGRMNLSDRIKTWVASLAKYAIHTFLLNASITRPLGETGKLKLTSDMTQLEFALGTFLGTGTMQGARNVQRLEQVGGEEYKALRSFRTVLFLDSTSLAHPEDTIGLAPLLVLHHIIVLSPLLLPHQVHNWTQAEYIAWVDKHSDKDAWALVERSVGAQKKKSEEEEWRELIAEVMRQAKE